MTANRTRDWGRAALREVATIERRALSPSEIEGGTLYVGLEHMDSSGGFLGVARVQSGDLASTKFRFTPSHILYGKLRPYLAKIARPAFSGVCSTDILPIAPGPLISKDFLYYYLRQPQMIQLAKAQCSGANLPRLSPRHLAEFSIPLPPLPEQKRIAAILDQADAIRRKRRVALDTALGLKESLFLEMFGDPMRNPKRWPRLSFGDRITLLQYGPRFYNEAYTPSGVRIVRITDLDFQGNLDFEAMPTLDVCKEDRERYRLLPGDLLLARSGATVGKTALIADDAPDCIAGAYFIRMRFTADVHPLYAQMILRSRSVQSLIAEKSRQSAQQNFNGPAIRSLPLPLPPRALQDSFARQCNQSHAIAGHINDHAIESNRLFACLAQRAFRGEL